MVLPSPRHVDSPIAGPERAKNLAGKCPPPDSDPFNEHCFPTQLCVHDKNYEKLLRIRQPQIADY